MLANLSPAMIPDYAQAPAVYVETDGNKYSIREYGETERLPYDKADYMRMSVAEKVPCYPFDDKGTDSRKAGTAWN